MASSGRADVIGSVSSMVIGAARKGKERITNVADGGRARLQLRQIRQDRMRLLEKLGREVVRLVEGGEVTHPGLIRGVLRVHECERRLEQGHAHRGDAGGKKGFAGGEDAE